MDGEDRTRTSSGNASDRIRVLSVGEPSGNHETADRLEREDDALTVEAKSSPGAALESLDDEWFDCIVSGYRTGGMDGVEFLRVVRADYDERPFVLFTGQGDETVASEAIRAGVTDYVPKESEDAYATLARRIRAAVERHCGIGPFPEFFESTPDALVVVDADGLVRRANERAEELFGADREELLGEPVELLVAGGDPDDSGYRERYLEAAGTGSTAVDDVLALRRDGSEFPVDATLGPVPVGDRPAVLVAVRDGTARADRDTRLRRLNDRLEEFASIVSHDLRNPMTVAEGNVELARRTGDLEYLERAEGALDRMQSLVEDLLTLVREGTAVEDPTAVSLPAVADTAWTTVDTGEATLRVVDDFEDLLADRRRLRQLLEHLFENAVEHGSTSLPSETPREAERDGVTVRLGRLERGFYVEDDGPGIPEADRAAAFEYGYSTSEAADGFGLALVENVAAAHGWSVSVTDSRTDGARFEVTGVEWAD